MCPHVDDENQCLHETIFVLGNCWSHGINQLLASDRDRHTDFLWLRLWAVRYTGALRTNLCMHGYMAHIDNVQPDLVTLFLPGPARVANANGYLLASTAVAQGPTD